MPNSIFHVHRLQHYSGGNLLQISMSYLLWMYLFTTANAVSGRFYCKPDTGGCSVIPATPVFYDIALCTHQLKPNYLLS